LSGEPRRAVAVAGFTPASGQPPVSGTPLGRFLTLTRSTASGVVPTGQEKYFPHVSQPFLKQFLKWNARKSTEKNNY